MPFSWDFTVDRSILLVSHKFFPLVLKEKRNKQNRCQKVNRGENSIIMTLDLFRHRNRNLKRRQGHGICDESLILFSFIGRVGEGGSLPF